MKTVLLCLALATTALGQSFQPERVLLLEGMLGINPTVGALKTALDEGWTVKHIASFGKDSDLVVILLPPSPERVAFNLEQARLKREAARAQRDAKATVTAVEKGKP